MSTPGAWTADAPVVIGVHLYERTPFTWTVPHGERRVVLHVEGANSARISLFTRRPDLVRLIEAATAALAELDTDAATSAA